MYSVNSPPTTRPVYGASRGVLPTFNTTAISTNVIAVSATSATRTPAGPGTVATADTGGSVNTSRNTRAISPAPAAPPTNWARPYQRASAPVTFPSRQNVSVVAGFRWA